MHKAVCSCSLTRGNGHVPASETERGIKFGPCFTLVQRKNVILSVQLTCCQCVGKERTSKRAHVCCPCAPIVHWFNLSVSYRRLTYDLCHMWAKRFRDFSIESSSSFRILSFFLIRLSPLFLSPFCVYSRGILFLFRFLSSCLFV